MSDTRIIAGKLFRLTRFRGSSRRLEMGACFMLSVAFVLFAGCAGPSGQTETVGPDGTADSEIAALEAFPEGARDGYQLAAENEAYALYFEETGLTVLMEDKETGQVLGSAGTPDAGSSAAWKNFVNSGVVIEYFKGKATNVNRLDM